MDNNEDLMDFYGNDYYIFEENCRQQLYEEEGHRIQLNMKKVSGYLKKLKKNGDDYKIKHKKAV